MNADIPEPGLDYPQGVIPKPAPERLVEDGRRLASEREVLIAAVEKRGLRGVMTPCNVSVMTPQGYVLVDRPEISDVEYDAIDAAQERIGGICRMIRPETLGYQMCWRLDGHDGAHLSQDSRAWTDAS